MRFVRALEPWMTIGGLALALAAAAGGCVGDIGDDGQAGQGGNIVGQTSQFQCDPSRIAPELPLRRLSRTQYQNTVRDLIASVAPNDVEAIYAEVAARVEDLPSDLRKGPDDHYGALRRLDQAIYQGTVNAAYEVGVQLGAALTEDSARLELLAGSCATDADASNDDACVDAFLRSFGARALRRPLDDADVAFYREVVGTNGVEPADYADMVTMLLSAPHFLYLVEHGQDGGDESAPIALTAYELASRLSFHFWQTMPDAELFAAAESGALLDEAEFERQVERLYRDPRTEQALGEFFADWLDPYHLQDLDAAVGTPAFDALRGDFTPTAELRGNMVGEMVDMMRYYAHGVEDGTFEDLYTTDRVFARTDDVATLYGVPVWAGGEPPAAPQPERQGLMTRAALTAAGVSTTHPVMKGVFVRKALLCDEVGAPPADAMAVANELEGELFTSREKAEAITSLRSDCAACHVNVINPLGFVTENYDGLGRFRSEEPIFDTVTGDVITTKPVDTSAVVRVESDDERVAAGAPDASRYMLESEKPQACFAREYFRFTFAREEDDALDGCTLVELHESLLAGEPLGNVLRNVALRPEFRRRRFEQ